MDCAPYLGTISMWSNEIVFRLFMEITLEKSDVGLTARKPIKERGFLLALLGALYLTSPRDHPIHPSIHTSQPLIAYGATSVSEV